MAKILHKQQRTGQVRFKPGNQAAVKWTDETILPELQKIWDVLTKDDSGLESGNPVRANDIKYVEEAVLCAGVELWSWNYWNKKEFKDKLPENSIVLLFLDRIKTVAKLRVLYSGQPMDMLFAKTHYELSDKIETKTDITTKGESLNQIDLSKLSDKALNELASLIK